MTVHVSTLRHPFTVTLECTCQSPFTVTQGCLRHDPDAPWPLYAPAASQPWPQYLWKPCRCSAPLLVHAVDGSRMHCYHCGGVVYPTQDIDNLSREA